MRQWVVLGVVLATLAASAPSAAAAWTAPADLSTALTGFDQGDPDDGFPSLAVNTRGDAVAVWLRKRHGFDDCCSGNSLMASYRPVGGRFEPPRPIAALGDDPSAPVATIDEAGNATAAWTVNELEADNDMTRPKIGFADRRAGALRFGPARTLRSGGWGAKWPRLVTVPGGETVILWTEAFPGDILDRKARIRAASRAGVADFGDPQVLPPRSLGFRAQTAGPGGRVFLTWLRTRGDATVLELSSRSPGGRFGEPRVVAESTGERGLSGESIAVDGERGVLVHWERGGAVRDASTSEARYLDSDGQLGPPESVPRVDGQRVSAPGVVFHPDGTAIAAWTDGGVLHRSTRLPGATFGPAEASAPPAAEPVPWPAGSPELVALRDGSTFAVWNRSFDQECDRYGCHPADYAAESARLPRAGSFELHGRVSPYGTESADVEPFAGGALALLSSYRRGPQIAGWDATVEAPPAGSRKVPRIGSFALTGCSGPKQHRRCTRTQRAAFTFTLSEPGTVAVRLCECPEEDEGRSLRVIRGRGVRGANRLPIPRRVLAAMRRGRYEASVVAENAAGNNSRKLVRLRFTIAGRP